MTPLPPGPELDAKVAEAIGWRQQNISTDSTGSWLVWFDTKEVRKCDVSLWHPSAEKGIAQALEALVEFCRQYAYEWSLSDRSATGLTCWIGKFHLSPLAHWEDITCGGEHISHAICLVIVAAREAEKEHDPA